jgi:hypothetical protein
MAFVLIENGVVTQKAYRARPGFVEVPDTVVCGQIDKGGGVFENPPPTPEQVAAAAQAAQDLADRQETQADAKFRSLTSKSPAQVKAWVRNRFPTLTLPEQDDLATVVQVVGVLARRL